jgi:hypothetical protein
MPTTSKASCASESAPINISMCSLRYNNEAGLVCEALNYGPLTPPNTMGWSYQFPSQKTMNIQLEIVHPSPTECTYIPLVRGASDLIGLYHLDKRPSYQVAELHHAIGPRPTWVTENHQRYHHVGKMCLFHQPRGRRFTYSPLFRSVPLFPDSDIRPCLPKIPCSDNSWIWIRLRLNSPTSSQPSSARRPSGTSC